MKLHKIFNIMLTFLVGASGIAIARGGHGGGGHGGGGHGHGGHSGHAGHAGHHAGGHHAGGHHAGKHNAGGHHGGRGRGGWGRGWNSGWGWGYGGWLWGATAAIIAGAWLFGGYTWDQWQEMADEDDEKRVYYETVVTPAYQQYQQNPESIPVRD